MNQLVESRCYPETPEIEAAASRSTAEVPARRTSWLIVGEWGVLIVLSYLFVWHAFLPGWASLKSEFPDYYLAAELYHRGIPLDRIYEWTWFQRQNDHLGAWNGLVSFAPNPPTSVLTMLPLSGLPPLAAKRVWMLLSLAFLALSIWLLRKVTALSWRRLFLITLLCVRPLSMDFQFGRHYVFILFCICAAYYAACRHRDWMSGAIWSVAAATKLFPALAVILFIRRRNWRAVGGFALGLAGLMVLSVVVFGAEVHRVFLREVLPQAPRGDWLGPYLVSQNSFSTLWSRLFLFEPAQNPSPWISSPALYAVAMAITVTIVLFSFLRATAGGAQRPGAKALQWSALVPMLLLLCTNTAPDYACLLIFTAIAGFDALQVNDNKSMGIALLVLYAIACAPMPQWILRWFPLYKLAATVALYILLLRQTTERQNVASGRQWVLAGALAVALFTFLNLRIVRNRDEDFDKRVLTEKPNAMGNPVPVENEAAAVEMQSSTYGAALLQANGSVEEIPLAGDVLSVAGSAAGSSLYSELAERKSFLVKIPLQGRDFVPETVTEGQQPSLSPNGKWLAFIREDRGRSSVWLTTSGAHDAAQPVLTSAYQPLEVTVTNEGDVISAVGDVSDPHLVLVRHVAQEIFGLPEFGHPTRYPSISPDGRRLAFSRRESGLWHLFVRALASGYERRLTDASCNAISPSWQDNETLLYATDCGRGIGLSAIARVVIPNVLNAD